MNEQFPSLESSVTIPPLAESIRNNEIKEIFGSFDEDLQQLIIAQINDYLTENNNTPPELSPGDVLERLREQPISRDTIDNILADQNTDDVNPQPDRTSDNENPITFGDYLEELNLITAGGESQEESLDEETAINILGTYQGLEEVMVGLLTRYNLEDLQNRITFSQQLEDMQENIPSQNDKHPSYAQPAIYNPNIGETNQEEQETPAAEGNEEVPETVTEQVNNLIDQIEEEFQTSWGEISAIRGGIGNEIQDKPPLDKLGHVLGGIAETFSIGRNSIESTRGEIKDLVGDQLVDFPQVALRGMTLQPERLDEFADQTIGNSIIGAGTGSLLSDMPELEDVNEPNSPSELFYQHLYNENRSERPPLIAQLADVLPTDEREQNDNAHAIEIMGDIPESTIDAFIKNRLANDGPRVPRRGSSWAHNPEEVLAQILVTVDAEDIQGIDADIFSLENDTLSIDANTLNTILLSYLGVEENTAEENTAEETTDDDNETTDDDANDPEIAGEDRQSNV